MHLPSFTQIITNLHGETGQDWLNNLPRFLDHFAQRWNLTLLPPFENLSYNYVCPAIRADGTQAVLKAHIPNNNELDTEAAALYAYGGRISCRLLEADPDGGAILLERLHPGKLLTTVTDDDQATAIAAEVMKKLWVPVPDAESIWEKVGVKEPRRFPTAQEWASELKELRITFGGGTGPFPAHLVEKAEGLFAGLFASPEPSVLLHGDLHHYNILSAERETWLIIDPKGLIGEPACETSSLLRNPIDTIYAHPDFPKITARRVDILADYLEIDRQRIIAWGIAQAVSSAWDDWVNHQQLEKDVLYLAEVLDEMMKRDA